MNSTRHPFVFERASMHPQFDVSLIEAENLEHSGKWYLAAERYREIAQSEASAKDCEDKAKLLAKAGSCFEIAGQMPTAAIAYVAAASELHTNQRRPVVAIDLYIRAARIHLRLDEWWPAAWNWRSAAEACAQLQDGVTASTELCSAGKYTLMGNCYTAAGDAFLLAGDEALWACGAYWQSGGAHSRQGHGYHAFVAYRKALVVCIKFYKTHEREQLRKCLPLTENERAAKLDPVALMEAEALRGNAAHQQLNAGILPTRWAKITTDQQVSAAFHEFYLAFLEIGNAVEAAVYRAREREKGRKLHVAERQWSRAILYTLWKITSGYGENFGRWFFASASVLLLFSGVYFAFDLVQPVTHWFDYIYFSVTTFTTSGNGDLHPVGLPGKVLACTEIICGLFMFASFSHSSEIECNGKSSAQVKRVEGQSLLSTQNFRLQGTDRARTAVSRALEPRGTRMLNFRLRTLDQIEAAVEALPLPQQQQLLTHLQTRLAAPPFNQADRETWLRQLDELRSRTKPGGASVQEVLDEIRADRC